MRKKARLLEHVADRTAMRRPKRLAVLPDLAVDRAEAVGQALQPGNAACDRRLAAAGRAEDRGDTGCRVRSGPHRARSVPAGRETRR